MIVKYARVETVTGSLKGESLARVSRVSLGARYATLNGFDFKVEPGFLYTTVRAISARVNRNYDSWSEAELAATYKTFIGKPVFVQHHNVDHRRARGVILAAKFHPSTSNDDAWVELLLEIDAVKFPRLAEAIHNRKLKTVSMGCNVEYTECSVCGKRIYELHDMCEHIARKGNKFKTTSVDPKTGGITYEEKLAYEKCVGSSFFEISYVDDPADSSADQTSMLKAAMKTSSDDRVKKPTSVDTLRGDSVCPDCGDESFDGVECEVCGYNAPPEEFQDPDTSLAKEQDFQTREDEGEDKELSRQRASSLYEGGLKIMTERRKQASPVERVASLEERVKVLNRVRVSQAQTIRSLTSSNEGLRERLLIAEKAIVKLAEDIEQLVQTEAATPVDGTAGVPALTADEQTTNVESVGGGDVPAEVVAVDQPAAVMGEEANDPGVANEKVLPDAPVAVQQEVATPEVFNEVVAIRALELAEARVAAGLADTSEKMKEAAKIEKSMSRKEIEAELGTLKRVSSVQSGKRERRRVPQRTAGVGSMPSMMGPRFEDKNDDPHLAFS